MMPRGASLSVGDTPDCWVENALYAIAEVYCWVENALYAIAEVYSCFSSN